MGKAHLMVERGLKNFTNEGQEMMRLEERASVVRSVSIIPVFQVLSTAESIEGDVKMDGLVINAKGEGG